MKGGERTEVVRESSYPNRTVLTHCGGFASLLFALRTAAAMSTPSPCVSIFERAAFVSSFDRITSCCRCVSSVWRPTAQPQTPQLFG